MILTGRTSVTTNYTGRSATPTTYSPRTSVYRYGSYLCDRLGNRICDRLGNPFVIYSATGTIDLGGTIYTSRTLI